METTQSRIVTIMADAKLTPEVEDVLRRSTVEGKALRLPGSLERPLYESVNKVLINAGAKWNRLARAHVFKEDPSAKLGLILEAGVAIDEKKLRQAFYTPPQVAETIAGLADVRGQTILEPSAGEASLANACRARGASFVLCIENHPPSARHCLESGFPTLLRDFLGVSSAPISFDRVVMNPPFARNQDIAHVAHALKFVRPGGLLVSIMPDSQHRSVFREFVAAHDSDVTVLPEYAFKESGTLVRTIAVKIKKVAA